MLLAVMGVVAVAAPALAAGKPKPLPSSAVVLPASRSCATSTLTVKVRKVPRVAWTGATIRFGSRRVATITRAAQVRAIKVGGVPVGRFTITVVVKARDGRRLTVKKTYGAC